MLITIRFKVTTSHDDYVNSVKKIPSISFKIRFCIIYVDFNDNFINPGTPFTLEYRVSVFESIF